jgi:hypothetical protein
MRFRTLLVIKATVCLVFGFLLLFLPGRLFGLLGAQLEPAGAFAAREYGAALFGIVVLTWLGRNSADRIARRAILIQLLLYDAIGCVVTTLAVLSGTLNTLGWGIVVVYAFFTLGPAYVLVGEKGVAN